MPNYTLALVIILSHHKHQTKAFSIFTVNCKTRRGSCTEMMMSDTAMLPKVYSTIDEIENDLRNNEKPHNLSPTTAIDTDNDTDDTLKDNNTNDKKDVRVDSSKTTQQQPHLFLHFDINETILIGDPAGGDTVTECLNKIIAKCAFVSTSASSTGDSNKEGNDTDKRPQLKRTPSSGNINEYSTHQLQPTHWWNGVSIDNDEDKSEGKNQPPPPLYTGWLYPTNTCPYYRTSYKRRAKQFTLEENHGSVYRPLYDDLCIKLGLSDDNDDDEHGEEEDVFKNFVPSFFHTLQHYFPSKKATTQSSSDNNRVTLVLRTFGSDLPRVAKCISEFAQGNHPSYPDYYNADLILDENNLFCSKWTYCNPEEGKEKELIYELHPMIQESSASIHSGDDEVLDYLQSKSIVGIQDNYPFWRDNNHQPWSGKPVWARTNGLSNNHPHNHHHILLDDNIHNDPNDGAGGIRIPVSTSDMDKSTSSYESLHGNEALDMHGKHLIRVPTIRPLLEDGWFIQQIENARLRVAQEESKGK